MKRAIVLGTVWAAAIVVGCDKSAVAPATTGSITLRVVTVEQAPASALAVDAPGAPVPAAAAGHLDAARVRVSGPTSKSLDLTPGPSGFSGTVDGLLAGSYTVVVEGLVASEVEHFGQTTGVQVVAGQNTSAAINFGSFRSDSLADLGPPTAGMTFTARWARVASAQSYKVEWDKNPSFASASSKDVPDTFATITVTDTGTYNVRVRAVNAWEPSGRASNAKSVWVVGNKPTQVLLTPGGAVLHSAGATQTFTAEARNPAGVLSGKTFAWTSLNPNVATVSNGGLVTAVANGSATIRATSEGVSGDAPVTVSQVVATVVVTPGTVSFGTLGRTRQLSAQARDSGGSGVGGKSFAWASGNPAVATVSSAGQVTAVANGTAMITAATDGVSTSALVSVSQVIASIAVTPTALTFAALGQTHQVTAAARDSLGNAIDGNIFSWSSSNSAVASVNASGLVTAVANGPATITAVAGGVSGSTAVTVGQLVASVVVTPSAVTLGTLGRTQQVTAQAQDSAGRPVVGKTFSWTSSNPSAASVSTAGLVTAVGNGTTTVTATADAVSGGTTVSGSTTVMVSQVASALAFTLQPSDLPQGRNVFPARLAIYPAIQVTVRDSLGSTVQSYTGGVNLALGANPSGGTITGGGPVTPVNGVAAFPNLTVDKVGAGYTLTALTGSLPQATSSAFTVSRDGDLNLDGQVDCLDLDVLLRAWNATDRPPADINKDGIVDVKDLSILLSSWTGVTQLAFTVQPNNAIRGTVITPAVQVTVQNGSGKTCGSATDNVTLAIGANPAAGTLSGTKSVAAANGVATFGNLSLDKAGTGYTLAASATGVTGATSGSFDVAAFGTATKLAFVTQPTSADINTAISPAVQVAIEDAQGNVVTSSSAPVTLVFGANPGGATLGGTPTVAAVSGVASFPDLTINVAALGYTVSATSSGLVSAASTAFNVADPAAATKLAFVQQATSTTAGSVIVPAVTVAIENRSGGTVTSDNSTVVSLTLASGPIGGTLRGTRSATVVNGIATFGSLSDTVSGTYTLSAAASGLTSATSNAYTISAGVASQLMFVSQPGNTEAGKVFGSVVRVAVTDQYGNTVLSATHSVSIVWVANGCAGEAWELKFQPAYYACSNLAGTITPPLVGTLTVAAVNGVATFSDLRPRFTEVYYLSAQASGVSGTNSNSFTVFPSVPTTVWPAVPWYGQSNQQTANVAFTVRAYVLDSLNNQVNAGDQVISLAIGSNPSNAVLNGTSNAAATSGRADFIVSLDKGGSGYTLVASSAGLSPLSSFALDVAPFGAPTRLGFAVQPSNATVGAPITPPLRVCVQDGVGNTVTTASDNLTIALGANPGGATLGGTLTVGATNGCATFANLTVSAAGTGYTLTVTASSLSGATSTTFNIGP